MNQEQNNFNMQNKNGNFNNQNTQQNINYNQPTSIPKKNNFVLLFVGIGAFIVGFIIVFVAMFLFFSNNSDELVCKSDEGNITIMYNDKTIIGYTAVGITYDLDGQKQVAEQIGIETYIDEFIMWFKTNTSGDCIIDNK